MRISSVSSYVTNALSYKLRLDGFNKDNNAIGDLWFNSFQQNGALNNNYAYGSSGNDSFTMGGFMNKNVAFGTRGKNKFTLNKGILNTNVAKGGYENDFFRVSNNGYKNKNIIDGGFGYDTVYFEGNIKDYIRNEKPDSIVFKNVKNLSTTTITNINDIKFESYGALKPDFNTNKNWKA
ncbi:MAG: hypothetical protein AB1782_04255 [Cyanobacteriota bacterium]